MNWCEEHPPNTGGLRLLPVAAGKTFTATHCVHLGSFALPRRNGGCVHARPRPTLARMASWTGGDTASRRLRGQAGWKSWRGWAMTLCLLLGACGATRHKMVGTNLYDIDCPNGLAECSRRADSLCRNDYEAVDRLDNGGIRVRCRQPGEASRNPDPTRYAESPEEDTEDTATSPAEPPRANLFYCSMRPVAPGYPRECVTNESRCAAVGECFRRAVAYCCNRPSHAHAGHLTAACAPTEEECGQFCNRQLPGRSSCYKALPDEIPASGDLE